MTDIQKNSHLLPFFESKAAMMKNLICISLTLSFSLSSPINAFAQGTNEVTTCGVTFDLPSNFKITRPKRSINNDGIAECAVQVLSAEHPGGKTECREKEEGGTPPYNVCDWAISGPPSDRQIIVASTNLAHDKKAVGSFVFKDDNWRISEDGVVSEEVELFGKTVFQSTITYRASWYRTRIKKYEGQYAGTGEADYVLMQLTPSVAISLESPPCDSDKECAAFYNSLKPAKLKK